MTEQTSTSAPTVPPKPFIRGDSAWMIPFFMIITTGIGFFFSQIAQFNLLPH